MIDKVERNYLDLFPVLVKELRIQEERGKNYIEAFCRKTNLRLTQIDCTSENGRVELMYVFNDNLGGYTLDAIIGSLM